MICLRHADADADADADAETIDAETDADADAETDADADAETDAAEPPEIEPMLFESAFEDCLGSAGIGYSDQVASILTPPTGQPVRFPIMAAEPVAVYGPETGTWWAVFVAANPQDREFLTSSMPTDTSYVASGRAIRVRGAITGWTDDDTLVASDLTPEQQAQLAPISTCALSALEHDQALTVASLDPDRPTTVELDGALMEIQCEGPDCQILANETHFTVPADGAAGELTGTMVYTIQFPAADGPAGCTNTLTRTIDYVGTVDETPEGSTLSGASWDFHEAFRSGVTGRDDPAWAGRVLADGTLHLVRTVTPEGCVEGADLEMPLPTPLVGYYSPAEQILSAIWSVGLDQYGNSDIDYLWAIGDM